MQSPWVVDAGGDDLVLGRESRPTLLHDLAPRVDPPADRPASPPPLDRREAVPREKGHGRTHDRRHPVASTDLAGDLDWPRLAPASRPARAWRAADTTHRQLSHGITRRPPAAADAARLRALKRG